MQIRFGSQDNADPIEHVILLMLENHSFDQMLGSFQQKIPDLNGIDPTIQRFNLDNKGNKVFQKEMREKQFPLDPAHELPDVLIQISGGNSGFVGDFTNHYPNSSTKDRDNIMGYYPVDFLPALHALAADSTICDSWFASLPGSTWPNRFFALSGTCSGRVKTPTGIGDPDIKHEVNYQTQKSIFDRLDEAKPKKSWRVYFGDFPISLALTHQRKLKKLKNYRKMPRFFEDAKGPAADFPAFTFIEPNYLIDQNDDHPPHNTMKTEKLIADVYNAIRANPKLWESTLLIINYDEHGGFYDHVSPPPAVPPDEHREEYTFDRLGVRVPALLISPYVRKGFALHTVFDHTSLLKYLIDKWQLNELGERTKQANSIAIALDFTQGPRQDCLAHIDMANDLLVADKPELEKSDCSTNHQAIHCFADFLETTYLNNTFQEKLVHMLLKFGQWGEARNKHTCKIVDNFFEARHISEKRL